MRKLGMGVLVVSGSIFIFLGVAKWLDYSAVRKVAVTFATALMEGDREAALLLLTPEQRSQFELEVEQGDDDFWTADPEITFRVYHSDIDGDTAVVQLWIDKQGYLIKPKIHLTRSELNRWKIDHIDNLSVDPIWEDRKYQQAQQEGTELADELKEALRGQPGVSIERIQMDQ